MTSLVLLLDTASAAPGRLEYALSCASLHGASLTGIFLPALLQPGNDREVAGAWEELFESRTAGAGIPSHWVNLTGAAALWEQLLNHLHAASLIITGQTTGDCYDGRLPDDLTERLVLGSGRPVITVPACAGKFTQCAQRVLVAWNDGRESTRALHDALPLLQKAQRVHLIKLITEENAITGADERLSGIIRHLAGAGVRAKGDLVISLNFPPADMLLNRACEESCDLLVMGAFRGDKPALGKIARQILQHMTLPVLMSH